MRRPAARRPPQALRRFVARKGRGTEAAGRRVLPEIQGPAQAVALEVSLKLGIDLTFATIQFRCALIGEIKGELKIDKEGTKEYCPESGKYYKTATEDWTASEITGNLRLQMLLFSADTVNVGGDIETGYSVKGRLTRGLSGGDVGLRSNMPGSSRA